MKRDIRNVVFVILNVIPFVIWMLYFYITYNNIIVSPQIATLQITLLLMLPLLFTVINSISSNTRRFFIIKASIFTVSHIVSYYLSGCLYYRYISDDSETLLVRDTLSLYSLLYIVILTAVVLIFKTIDMKHRNKPNNK